MENQLKPVAPWAVLGTTGALAVQHLSWRWAFYLNAPVGLISILPGRRFLPEGKEAKPGLFPDPLTVGLLVSALGLMAYAFVQSGEWGGASARFLGVLSASFGLLAAFIVRSRRAPNPLFDLKLFLSPSFRLANAATLIFSMGFSAMFLGNVLFLTRVWGYPILRAGMVVSLGPLVVAVTAPFFGKLAGRLVMLSGLAVSAISFLLPRVGAPAPAVLVAATH